MAVGSVSEFHFVRKEKIEKQNCTRVVSQGTTLV